MNHNPEMIENESQLNELLSRPHPELVDFMKTLEGDILILGAGGKMGPTVAEMAIRACEEAGVQKIVYAVSRFTNPNLRRRMENAGAKTIACDLLDLQKVQSLPRVKNVIFMAGRKFGSVGSEPLTWMMNAIVPYHVASIFKQSRIVVFSTGCVYGLEYPEFGGSKETDVPVPIGEYANSCLGRERIFDYFSEKNGTPVLFFRLNYAIDLRYGVLVDIAQRIQSGRPVSLSSGYVNIIWQGDAASRALLCLNHAGSPGVPLNVTGPEILQVRLIALKLGKHLEKKVLFEESHSGPSYLSDASRSLELFGEPEVKPDQMIKWVAHWIRNRGATLDNPTHFEVTDGQFLD